MATIVNSGEGRAMKERQHRKYKSIAEWVKGEWLTLQPFIREAEELGRQIGRERAKQKEKDQEREQNCAG